MLSFTKQNPPEYGIAIVGLGGAGANILQCFGGSSADNVRMCIMSLDERLGHSSGNVEFLQLGIGLSHGMGSGGDPEVGRRAAESSRESIAGLLKGKRLLVMVVGLGGGTGSGAAPVLAQMAHDEGLFLVSVVVMPFSFEGRRRREQAEAALAEVNRLSDIVFCFENDYMEELFRNRTGVRAVFAEVNRILAKATASVPMLASAPGLINLGLDELATALENRDSRCIFGSGSAFGAHRARDAARDALASPLMSYHGSLRFARTVIVHIAGGDNMSLTELRTAMETIREGLAGEQVEIFFGASVKPHLGDEIRVAVIASLNSQEFAAALRAEAEEQAAPSPEPEPDEQQEDEPEPTPEEAEAPEPADEAEEPTADEPETVTENDAPEEENDEEGDTFFPVDEPMRVDRSAARNFPRFAPREEEEDSPLAPQPSVRQSMFDLGPAAPTARPNSGTEQGPSLQRAGIRGSFVSERPKRNWDLPPEPPSFPDDSPLR